MISVGNNSLESSLKPKKLPIASSQILKKSSISPGVKKISFSLNTNDKKKGFSL